MINIYIKLYPKLIIIIHVYTTHINHTYNIQITIIRGCKDPHPDSITMDLRLMDNYNLLTERDVSSVHSLYEGCVDVSR